MFAWVCYIDELIKKFNGVEELIEKIKKLGIDSLCIKFHEGEEEKNFRTNYYKYGLILKDQGIKVGTWGVNKFNDVNREEELILEALNNSDYYIFSLDKEVGNRWDEIEKLLKGIRTKSPKAVLGYSTYPIVNYHDEVPYKLLNKYCDFSSPKCYFKKMHWSINRCFDTTINDYNRFALNKPMYPTIQVNDISILEFKVFEKYGFKNFGLENLENISKDLEIYLIEKVKENILENLILYDNNLDKMAAEYLGDFLKAPIIDKEFWDGSMKAKKIYVVGGEWIPNEEAVLIKGNDNLDIALNVLKFIGKV